MWFFWVFALLPLAIGAVVWIKNKEVTWWEWAIASAIGFAMALIFQLVATFGMTTDIETWSGHAIKATHFPRWVEEYTTTETYTDSDGETHTRIVTKHRTHPEHWTCVGNYGSEMDEWEISEAQFRQIARWFGGIATERPYKSGFDSGDPNIYVAYNKTGYVLPVTMPKRWENRVKAAPSVFSFAKVPKSIPVFQYPENGRFTSNRLLGAARSIPIQEWDKMCSRLGPKKKVNVILIGFSGSDSSIAQYQEAAWIGGKKNDLVLCYGDNWSYVFGWTEQEIVKRNLETVLLTNPKDISIIPLIEEEIEANYIIKDWSKFDYISIEPPMWSYILYIVIMILSQIGLYVFAHFNDWKTEDGR